MSSFAIFYSILLLTVVCRGLPVADEGEEEKETTETSTSRCLQIFECCDRRDDGCMTYCEPRTECSEEGSTTENIQQEAFAGYKIIVAPCRKGHQHVGGTCRKAF